jgi:hypothetical protein
MRAHSSEDADEFISIFNASWPDRRIDAWDIERNPDNNNVVFTFGSSLSLCDIMDIAHPMEIYIIDAVSDYGPEVSNYQPSTLLDDYTLERTNSDENYNHQLFWMIIH